MRDSNSRLRGDALAKTIFLYNLTDSTLIQRFRYQSLPDFGGGAKIPGGTTGPVGIPNLSISSSSSERSASEKELIAGSLEKAGSGLGAGAEDSAGLNAELMGPLAGADFGAEAGAAACAGLKGLGSEDCVGLNGPEGAADCAG